jgi:hypothetical protein
VWTLFLNRLFILELPELCIVDLMMRVHSSDTSVGTGARNIDVNISSRFKHLV